MHLIVDRNEINKIWKYFVDAAIEATNSLCAKSQRGAVIVADSKIIGRGYSKPLLEHLCDPCIREAIKDNSRAEMCSAIHAEQLAILDALEKGYKLPGSRMYHIKVKLGKMIPSGKPSCTLCSRFIHYYKIEFAIWHQEGIGIYQPRELDELSFSYFRKN